MECAIGEAENENEVFSALVHNTKNQMQIYLTTAGIGLIVFEKKKIVAYTQ